jgi:hypothetical protein
MKKILAVLAFAMLAMRMPAPIFINPPVFTGIIYSPSNTATIYATNYPSGGSWRLVMSTNLATTNWTVIASNISWATGTYSITNVPATNGSAFFRLQFP